MKKGLLLIALILSIFLYPIYSYSYEYDDYSYTDDSYLDLSDDEFEDLLDNLTYEDIDNFLNSLSDEELYYLLEEAGITEEEFQDLMDMFYSYDEEEWSYDDFYEDEDGWEWDDIYEDYDDVEDSYDSFFDTELNNHSDNKNPKPSLELNNNAFASKSIGDKVYKYAQEYTTKDTLYVKGGQGKSKSIQIDCSGLVINCYKEALKGSNYSLPFNDTSAYYLYSKYSEPTSKPERGDLIFMNYGWGDVDHVGIFDEIKDGKVYFIDATLNNTNKNGQSVNRRSYPVNDYRVVSYGKMKLMSK